MGFYRKGLNGKVDRLFAKYIRLRDGYVCQRCGTKYEKGSRAYQCAHIESRRKQSTCWNEANAFGLCKGCHKYIDTYHSAKRDFYIEKMGEIMYRGLLDIARDTRKWTKAEKEEVAAIYKKKINDLDSNSNSTNS